MAVLELNSIKDTALWKRLESGFSGADGDIAQKLSVYLVDICKEAYDRMRGFASIFPQYTLHDEVHLLRVTELMDRVMPSSVADKLNPVEIALLILSANFHDQGMALEADELSALDTDAAFRIFKDNWEIEHPNLTDVRLRLKDQNLSDSEQKRLREAEHELQAALLTDFARLTHGERSANYVRATYVADPRWVVGGTHLGEFVARLSLSHVRPATDLVPANGFRFDESIGTYRVNMPYLGLILRLADILDLDRDRTPDSLYRTINFRSGVSLQEWEKHRSVDGWVIEPTLVQFTMRCEHPEYQRAAYQFMDWIDRELTDAQLMMRNSIAQVSHYRIDLPLAVDRSRIEPKDDAYIYHDLEFSLSRDEVVKLLMTNKLYGGPWLCVRELLQNSLDALRYRKALIKRDNASEWEQGKVDLRHEIDKDGHEVTSCIDNGSGMDKQIIQRFLTNVGRSYYRSPEFEQERASFRSADVDFDPCAQFGIGFMSCFMLGDHVLIHTRRDYGPNRGLGEPLSVEINGLGGIVVVRKGMNDQPIGTTVKITGRKKPRFVDEFVDRVKLLEVVEGYALACEFPIEATCSIPEIEGSINVPPTIALPRTLIEKSKILNYVTVEQDLSEIEPLLRGAVRISFIVDENGRLTLANSEARWQTSPLGTKELVKLDGAQIESFFPHGGGQVCFDGILVAGEPGRGAEQQRDTIGSQGSPFDTGRGVYIVDVRGNIKAPLTPARTIADHWYRLAPGWENISHLIDQGHARLWERVSQQLESGLSPDMFWQVLMIHSRHRNPLTWLRAGALWSRISLPIVNPDGSYQFRRISSLGILEPRQFEPAQNQEPRRSFYVFCSDGARIGHSETLSEWRKERADRIDHELAHLAVIMSTVVLVRDEAMLEVRVPSRTDLCPEAFNIWGDNRVMALPYSAELRDFFSVHLAARSVNRDHLLAVEALRSTYLEQPSALQEFARRACHFMSDPEALEPVNDPSLPVTRWHKIVGSRYMDVYWPAVSPELHPPYQVRLLNGEVLQINRQHFEAWALAEYERK